MHLVVIQSAFRSHLDDKTTRQLFALKESFTDLNQIKIVQFWTGHDLDYFFLSSVAFVLDLKRFYDVPFQLGRSLVRKSWSFLENQIMKSRPGWRRLVVWGP